ncbi:MAG: ribonuclease P protein component [Acidimicrobiia bacterium]
MPKAVTSSPHSGRGFVPLRPGSRFASIYRTGIRTRRGGLTVLAAAGQSESPEVGVVAGKKVGNAVNRNRAKRRMREAAARAPLSPGRAYVLIASPPVTDVAFDELVEWTKAGVLDVAEKDSP